MFTLSKLALRVAPQPLIRTPRFFHTVAVRLQEQKSGTPTSQGSFFSDIQVGPEDSSRAAIESNRPRLTDQLNIATDEEGEGEIDEKTLRDRIDLKSDEVLQKFINSPENRPNQQPASQLLLSPLKRQLYEANCTANGGFYKADTVVTLPNSNEKYKLHLSKEEIEVLEPSVYLKSYRIKSSMKKATIFLRILRGLDLKDAINQCHFSPKGIATEVGELLERGIEDSKTLGLDPNDMYIAQIWTGSDGNWSRQIEFKGRGRLGILTHRYVHVRCILKCKSITKRRLKYEQQVKDQKRKPWIQLGKEPVRGSPGGVYKW